MFFNNFSSSQNAWKAKFNHCSFDGILSICVLKAKPTRLVEPVGPEIEGVTGLVWFLNRISYWTDQPEPAKTFTVHLLLVGSISWSKSSTVRINAVSLQAQWSAYYNIEKKSTILLWWLKKTIDKICFCMKIKKQTFTVRDLHGFNNV